MSNLEGMEDVLKEFLVESYENLDQLDQDFVTLEEAPDNLEILAGIFRTIHTIKGTSGFFGFSKLESVAHKGENLLSLLREGKKRLTAEITSALLSMVDAVRTILGHIEEDGCEGDADYSTLIDHLMELTERPQDDGAAVAAPVAKAEEPVVAAPTPEAAAAPQPEESVEEEADDEEEAAEAAEELAPPVQLDESAVAALAEAIKAQPELEPDQMGSLLVKEGLAREEDVEKALAQQAEGDPRHIGEILVDQAKVQPAQVKEKLNEQSQVRSRTTTSVADTTLRVDVNHLDKLMTLAGELVLIRNQVMQYSDKIQDNTYNAVFQRLNLITTELQEGVMKTRMQPIGNVWNKFPRVIRDLSMSCGKKVRLEMEGKDTELDKTLLEAIKDPLTHIVRNSVDHGIESPEVRRANGKPEEGVVKLLAYHEGGQVNVEILDDGGGIDAEAVRRKAIDRGLVTPEYAERMSDHELVNMVFLPGFSTAKQVTNVSGRGVGMDVVKTNIEKIGGMVDLSSRAGNGTRLKIKIPLTLAIIPALVVRCAGMRFAMPQAALLELVRLEGEQANNIETINGAPVYRLRGKLLPLVFLDKELNIFQEHGDTKKTLNIVVLQADDRQFGLVVDEVIDTEEIVVKPLGSTLKNIPTFAGATIMGDGSVALIIDVLGLAQRSHVVSDISAKVRADAQAHAAEVADDSETLLLFRVGHNRMAIALDQVDRLEEFEVSKVEHTGDGDVIQYREKILPLLKPSEILPERRGHGEIPPNETGERRQGAVAGNTEKVRGNMLQVVVYSTEGRSYGIVVDEILDIAEENVTIKRDATRAGVLGVIVVQDRITELLDIETVIHMAQ